MMTIRDHWHRFFSRRSFSSTSSSASQTTATTGPACSSHDDDSSESGHHTLSKPPSRLTRNLTWRSRKTTGTATSPSAESPPSSHRDGGQDHERHKPGAHGPRPGTGFAPHQANNNSPSPTAEKKKTKRLGGGGGGGGFRRKLHPSERPLTETNLRHQEMLSGFTMQFGRRSSAAWSFDVSPRGSRVGSFDDFGSWFGDVDPYGNGTGTVNRVGPRMGVGLMPGRDGTGRRAWLCEEGVYSELGSKDLFWGS